MRLKIKKGLCCAISIALTLLVFTACGEKEKPKEIKVDNPIIAADDYSDCERILSNMTTEEKIALKIMPTFRYSSDDTGSLVPVKQINSDIEMILGRHGFAGVILFSQNISNAEQTYKFIYDMQSANSGENRTKLFIGIDQEGGSISRIDYGTSFCGNMALAATSDTNNALECGKIIGSELSTLGFNLNFAPVLDLNTNPFNPVIGTRSFSDDPKTAADFGNAYIEGLHNENICAAIKHFPGHGDTSTDSHTGLPCINKTYDEIKELELLPFKQCAVNTDMVMTAHIQFPQIETETYISKSTREEITLPATLSKTIINDILRKDIGYDGVVITDAMQMEAISTHFDEFDSAKLAFNAGVDILLMPLDMYSSEDYNNMTGYIQNLAVMTNKGDISIEAVDESVMRILKLKKDKGLLNSENLSQLNYETLSSIGSNEHRQAEWDITKKSITLIQNNNNALPIKSGNTLLIVKDDNQCYSIEDTINSLKNDGKIEKYHEISVISSENDISDIFEEMDNYDNIIALSDVEYVDELNPYSGTGSSNMDSLIYHAHENGAKFAVISCGLPYDCARYTEADSIMLAWCSESGSEDSRVTDGKLLNYSANIPCALYYAFSNESPTGKLPLDIPQLDYSYGYSGEILYNKGYGIGY